MPRCLSLIAFVVACLAIVCCQETQSGTCVAPLVCEVEPNYVRAVIDVDESTSEIRVTQFVPTAECGSDQPVEYEPVVVSRSQTGPLIGDNLQKIGLPRPFAIKLLSFRAYTTNTNVSLVIAGSFQTQADKGAFICRNRMHSLRTVASGNTDFGVLSSIWCALLPSPEAQRDVLHVKTEILPLGRSSWGVVVAYENAIAILDFETGETLFEPCIPVIPKAHAVFSTNQRVTEIQNVSLISSLAVSGDGSLLAIGTSGSVYQNSSSPSETCYGSTNETQAGGLWMTTYGWDMSLEGNFVVAFSVQSLLSMQTCTPEGPVPADSVSVLFGAPTQTPPSPPSGQVQSPVLLVLDRCLSPVKTISFSPKSEQGWYNLAIAASWPLPKNVNAERLNADLTPSLSYDEILERKSGCIDLCAVRNSTSSTCEDSLSFRDRLGGDCSFYSFAMQEQNKTCTQLAQERGVPPENVLGFCSGTCVCNVARYAYHNTICKDFLDWTCADCDRYFFTNQTCAASPCLYANDNGNTVATYCSTTCSDLASAIDSCSGTELDLKPSFCSTDFENILNLLSTGIQFNVVSCPVAPSNMNSIVTQVVQGEMIDISWTRDFLAVTTSAGIALLYNVTVYDNHTISAESQTVLSLSSVTDVQFSGDNSIIGLLISDNWQFFEIGADSLRALSVNKTFNTALTFGSPFSVTALFDAVNAIAVSPFITAANATQAIIDFVLSSAIEFQTGFTVDRIASNQVVPVTGWNITLSTIITGFQFKLFIAWPEEATDGFYSISPSDSKNIQHTMLLDHVRPVLTFGFSNNSQVTLGSNCGLTSNPFVTFQISASESTSRLCVGGASNGVLQSTNTPSETSVLIKTVDQAIYSECGSTACSLPDKCEMVVAISCAQCEVEISVAANTVVDVAANGNEFASLTICMDRVAPVPVFWNNGTVIDGSATVPNPATIVLDFGEVVAEMVEAKLDCDCTISNFVALGGGQYQFDVSFSSVTQHILAIEAQMVQDLAGNVNSRSTVTLTPQPIHTFVNGSVFVAVVCVASLVILLIVVTSALIVRYRNSQLIRSSSPLFSQLILFGFVLVMLANICIAIGMADFAQHTRDQSCTAAIHLLSYGVTLFFAPLVVRNYRVWRVVDNPTLNNVVITMRDLFAAVAAMLLLVISLLAIWTGLYGGKSRVVDTTTNSFYVCRYDGVGFLYAVLCLEGICALVGGFVIARIYKTNVDGPFNETKAIAFSFYNSLIVTAVFGIGQSGIRTSGTSIALMSVALLYFVACPLLVMFWLTKLYFILSHKKDDFNLQTKSSRRKDTQTKKLNTSGTTNEMSAANLQATSDDQVTPKFTWASVAN